MHIPTDYRGPPIPDRHILHPAFPDPRRKGFNEAYRQFKVRYADELAKKSANPETIKRLKVGIINRVISRFIYPDAVDASEVEGIPRKGRRNK